jgi:hypothetical protein
MTRRTKAAKRRFGSYTATLETLAHIFDIADDLLAKNDPSYGWTYLLRRANEWRTTAARQAGIR